jgi:hypothetical protein
MYPWVHHTKCPQLPIEKILDEKQVEMRERQGWRLERAYQFYVLPVEKLRVLADNEITSGNEPTRKKDWLLPMLQPHKKFDMRWMELYVLAEAAHDEQCHFALGKMNSDKPHIQFMIQLAKDLAERARAWSSAMYWLVLEMCTPYKAEQADRIVSSYDIDRPRGRRRVVDMAQSM